MEQFHEPHNRIREKNMYLLHLDTPRIILVALAVIGVVIASFLLGMNFSKGDGTSLASVSDNDTLLKGLSDLSPSNPEIPDAAITDDKADKSSEKEIAAGDLINKTGNLDKTAPPDLLTGDNLHDIIQPSKETAKTEVDKTPSHDKISDSGPKSPKHVSPSKSKHGSGHKDTKHGAKHKVVEVSSDESDSHVKIRKGFAIQVASFDSKAKANSEVSKLKGMNYDAYIDKITIQGKRYFRVRIGPIQKYNKAEKILQELQDTDRYGESFLIRQ
jgi:cell division septation protein DedD